MGRIDQIYIFCTPIFEVFENIGKLPFRYLFPTQIAGKLEVLAERAFERTAAEKYATAAVFERDGRLFKRMKIIFCYFYPLNAARAAYLFTVGATGYGALETIHN